MNPSELDSNIVDSMRYNHGVSVDAQKLSKKLNEIKDPEHNLFEMIEGSSGYERKAISYLIQQKTNRMNIYTRSALAVKFGYLMIMSMEKYYRFEPCLKRMFEMERDEVKKLADLYDNSMQSEYMTISSQSYNKLSEREGFPSLPEGTDGIKSGLDSYNDAMDIVERGLPLLVGFKRILDGHDELSLQKLQRLKLRSMMEELTDKTNESYCYFDLIVSMINKDIRNAIAHGDVLIEPSKSIVKFPNAGTEHTFSTIRDEIRDIYAVSIFLSGTFHHNIPPSVISKFSELGHSDILPTQS